ncbi:hypothetical protein F5878DRAFT_609443 [Lentinula raphanica]|uniref:Uncharacterized protein n=1 Tax=Lentinula raphanica TaxID=153919 RepID=A0AA38PFL2_9AGAR|nr:hypothetical protein F5878DRAFT_609443 [Lentinula raphanica]
MGVAVHRRTQRETCARYGCRLIALVIFISISIFVASLIFLFTGSLWTSSSCLVCVRSIQMECGMKTRNEEDVHDKVILRSQTSIFVVVVFVYLTYSSSHDQHPKIPQNVFVAVAALCWLCE